MTITDPGLFILKIRHADQNNQKMLLNLIWKSTTGNNLYFVSLCGE